MTSGEPVLIYCDSSALVKLVIAEAESEALQRWLLEREGHLLVSSVLGRTETLRAVRRTDDEATDVAAELLTSVALVDLDAALADEAGALDPLSLRSLDAIHLASAQRLGDALGAFVAYDARLAEAALAAELPVVQPGAAAATEEDA